MIYQDPPKSNQEAFDRVWQTFIVEKKPRAVGPLPGRDFPGCVYRTPDKQHGCALGCQIPDALYREEFENQSAFALLGFEPMLAKHFGAVEIGLLQDLQEAHDRSNSENIVEFKSRLERCAEKWKLQVAA